MAEPELSEVCLLGGYLSIGGDRRWIVLKPMFIFYSGILKISSIGSVERWVRSTAVTRVLRSSQLTLSSFFHRK